MKFDYFDMLSGEPIHVGGVGTLRSPKLKELSPNIGIGFELYNVYLTMLTCDRDKMLQYDKIIGLRGVDRLAKAEKLTAYDIITLIPQTRDLFREMFSFFLIEDVEWDENSRKYVAYLTDDDGQHVSGEINRDNFDDVRIMMSQLNFIGLDKDSSETKHSSESSKELWEKAQQFLKKQSESKETKKDNTKYCLGNIISKLCSAHPTYNLLNVWELTVFQLYDAFFQLGYMRSINLNEAIFYTHGGEKFNFEDWLNPILKIT